MQNPQNEAFRTDVAILLSFNAKAEESQQIFIDFQDK